MFHWILSLLSLYSGTKYFFFRVFIHVDALYLHFIMRVFVYIFFILSFFLFLLHDSTPFVLTVHLFVLWMLVFLYVLMKVSTLARCYIF